MERVSTTSWSETRPHQTVKHSWVQAQTQLLACPWMHEHAAQWKDRPAQKRRQEAGGGKAAGRQGAAAGAPDLQPLLHPHGRPRCQQPPPCALAQAAAPRNGLLGTTKERNMCQEHRSGCGFQGKIARFGYWTHDPAAAAHAFDAGAVSLLVEKGIRRLPAAGALSANQRGREFQRQQWRRQRQQWRRRHRRATPAARQRVSGQSRASGVKYMHMRRADALGGNAGGEVAAAAPRTAATAALPTRSGNHFADASLSAGLMCHTRQKARTRRPRQRCQRR